MPYVAGCAVSPGITWLGVAECGWVTVAVGSQLGFQLGYRPASDGPAAAVVIGVLRVPCCRGERPDPAEVLIAARRLAGTRPHLAAVAGLVHPKDL